MYRKSTRTSPSDIIAEDIKIVIDQVGTPIRKLEGTNLLISGAAGFLGSWFVAVLHYLNEYTFQDPCKVYAIDSGIASDQKNSLMYIDSEHISWQQEDIASANIQYKLDYIIHAAGIASPVYYRRYPIETIDGTVLGLSKLLKFAAKNPVKSFLYFSSSEVYGNPHHDQVPTREMYNGNVSPLGPRSCYDESKRMGEAMCAAYHRVHNIPVKWVRPFNVSGPGMRVNDDRVIPRFVFAGLQSIPVTVHLPGLQTRTFCYVGDAMVGFFKALLIGTNGDVYNIGRNQEEIAMVDLARKVQDAFRGKLKVKKVEAPIEYPQDQTLRRCPDLTKARKELGYDPKVPLDEIIARTIEWGKGII